MPSTLWSFLERPAFQKSQVLKMNEKVRSRGSGVSRDGMHPEVLREPANVIVKPQLTIFERSQ